MEPLGFGIEPDGRRTDAMPSLDAPASIFRLGEDSQTDTENESWRLVIDVATCCVGVETSIEARKAAMDKMPPMPGVDRNRLAAYASIAAVAPTRIARTLKAASDLDLATRMATMGCAVAAVVMDGASPTAVRGLERVAKALDFPVDDLYGALHRGRVDTPSFANEAEAGTRTDAIVDEGRLARAREDTHAVSRMLAEVFTDDHHDVPETLETSTPGRTDTKGFDGLDGRHSELLAALLAEGCMAAKDFATMARNRKLMPDGALERINEWGYDRFDDLLVDEGEFLTVAEHLRTALEEITGSGK
jgi:hypothetical protein